MNHIPYNTAEFNFRDELLRVFNIEDLSELNETREVLKREEDQNTKWHSKYYEWARTPEFTALYESFIAQVVLPFYGERIVYQAIPTFRIAYPNNIAVGEWHKDKWYRNGEWAEKVKEDNFFMPFTDAFDTNTIWAETEENKGDFIPLTCKYGELIKWDGCNLTHGNKINQTGKARVSVDFRVIKYANYVPSDHGSINTKTPFTIGGYYKVTD